MMIKDSIDDEKVSRQKQFDRFCYYLGGVKQLLDEKAVYAASILQIYAVGCIHISGGFIHGEWSLFYLHCIMEKFWLNSGWNNDKILLGQ